MTFTNIRLRMDSDPHGVAPIFVFKTPFQN